MTIAEKKKEAEILHNMKALSITREEAEELWLFDNDKADNEEADRLTKKVKDNKIMGTIHEAKAENAKKTSRKPRTTKENPEKADVITKVADFLTKFVENVTITNKERQIAFSIGENDYELTLVAKRKSKKQLKTGIFPQF